MNTLNHMSNLAIKTNLRAKKYTLLGKEFSKYDEHLIILFFLLDDNVLEPRIILQQFNQKRKKKVPFCAFSRKVNIQKSSHYRRLSPTSETITAPMCYDVPVSFTIVSKQKGSKKIEFHFS